MNTLHPKVPACLKRKLALAMSVPLFTASLLAQQTNQDTAEEEEDDVLVLSPFEVDGSGDQGYYSSQTLAGGRLNSDLKNIATSVQVVTEAFMEDIGATGLDEVLNYTTSTEVFGSMSGYQQISSGRNNDDQQQVGDLDNSAARQNPNAAARVRGMAAPTRTTNFFESSIPFDSFNSTRIDINRGANSFLFGLGSPGGIVNNTLNQADLNRDSTRIDVRFSTEDFEDNFSQEYSFDFNKAIIEDTLAVRLAAKKLDDEYMQKPAFTEQTRVYGAVRFKPFEDRHIILSANYEVGDTEFISIERNGPLETLSTFINSPAGDVYGPVTDVDGNVLVTNAAQRYIADGFGNVLKNSADPANTNYYTGVDANGNPLNFNFYNNHFLKRNGWALVYDGTEDANGLPTRAVDTGWTNNRFAPGSTTWDPYGNLSGRNRSWLVLNTNPQIGRIGTALVGQTGQDFTRYVNQGLLDYDVFDFRRNLITGSNDLNSNDFDRLMVSLETVSSDGNYGVSIDYAGENFERTGFSLTGSPRIDIDINYNHVVGPNTLFGETNPNFGRLYFYASASDRTFITEDRNAIRATAFAKIDFEEKFADSFLGKLGRHTVSLLLDENDYTREQVATEPLVMGNHADFHISNDAQIFQRESSAIFYISEPYLNAFEDPNFQLSDFRVTPLDPRVNVHVPEDHSVPLVFKSEGNPLTDPNRNNPLGDEMADYGEYTAAFRPIEGILTGTETSSQALNLQSFVLGDLLVANLGWRRDKVDIRRFNSEKTTESNAPGEPQNLAILDPASFNLDRSDVRVESGTATNFGYGLVLRTPSQWLPDGMGLSFHYGENSNFVAAPGQFDWYGENLPGQEGTTKEYGFTVSALNDKVVVRLTRYQGDIKDDAFGDAAFAYRVFANVMSRQYRDLWEARDMADQNQDGVFDLGLDGIDPDMNKNGYLDEVEVDPDFMTNYLSLGEYNTFMGAYEDVWSDFVLDQMQFTFTPKTATEESVVTTSQIVTGVLSDTADIVAEGYEIEVTLNPTRNLRIAFNATEGTIERSNVALRMGSLLEEFIEAFESGPNAPRLTNQGNPLGVALADSDFAPNTLLGGRMVNTGQAGAYYLGQALNGTPTPESARYSFRGLANYSFDEGRLKGFNVGGGYRWQDKSAIGYPNLNDPDVPVIIPDVANPYWSDTQSYADFWVGYRRAIFNDKANWRIQLNIRNVFADTDPVPIQAQPDGSIARVAIPVPRQFVLTNTFTF